MLLLFCLILGLVKAILAWRPLVPLSKLSYGAYLIHAVVIWYSAGVVREPAYSNSYILVSILYKIIISKDAIM
jgi:peptidoglycan/LPS O-acetylase OafA/YrhL